MGTDKDQRGGVEPEVQELLPDYLARCAVRQLALEGALERSEFGLLEQQGHRYKGSAGCWGLWELGDLGSALECAARDRDRPGCADLLHRMDQCLRRAADKLDRD
ncbi:MAG: Hpt domain-containing protein [Desulfovibrionaceae bacterium]